nr:ACP S-malonyltransferase [uncultured Olsenella sp.]
MGKVALLFAGQGAQHPGMADDLVAREPAARQTFELLEARMPGLGRLCREGSREELAQTRNTQPAVFACDLAAARALASHGVRPDAVAGFSLGELSALAFAGAFSPEDAFDLVLRRAELMDSASRRNPGGMRAVLRLPAGRVEDLAVEAGDAWPVNYNSAEQTVVAGTEEALGRLDALVREAGGRCMRLTVSGAFHSPLMAPASEGLREWLARTPPAPATVPVWANATARPYPDDPAAMAELLAGQASSPVRWQQTVEGLVALGVDTFVEVGPGSTLTKLVGRIAPGATALPCETPDQLDVVLAHLEGRES